MFNSNIRVRGREYLLIAGKGHEKYQHIGGRKYSFSDNEVVLAFLGSI